MIKINLPMPTCCDDGRWGCPCYDNEMQACKAVVPNRDLYNPSEGIDYLSQECRPDWCPLEEIIEK